MLWVLELQPVLHLSLVGKWMGYENYNPLQNLTISINLGKLKYFTDLDFPEIRGKQQLVSQMNGGWTVICHGTIREKSP